MADRRTEGMSPRRSSAPATSRADLASYAGGTVPDLVGPDPTVLFIGINPSLWSAATGTHFARPGNRFYPALAAAGFTPHVIDARDGYRPEDRALLLERGIAITNIVARATARADELTRDELLAGAAALPERIARIGPRVIAFLGLTSYRTAFRRPRAAAGRQADEIADLPVWVLPNPSGLNAHETVHSLAAAYAEPGREAGAI